MADGLKESDSIKLKPRENKQSKKTSEWDLLLIKVVCLFAYGSYNYLFLNLQKHLLGLRKMKIKGEILFSNRLRSLLICSFSYLHIVYWWVPLFNLNEYSYLNYYSLWFEFQVKRDWNLHSLSSRRRKASPWRSGEASSRRFHLGRLPHQLGKQTLLDCVRPRIQKRNNVKIKFWESNMFSLNSAGKLDHNKPLCRYSRGEDVIQKVWLPFM